MNTALKLSHSDDEKITLKYLCSNFDLTSSERVKIEEIKRLKQEIVDLRNKALFREKEMRFRDFEFYLSVAEIKCNVTIKRSANGIRYYFALEYLGNTGSHLSDLYERDSEINRINASESLYFIFGIEKPTRTKYTKKETEDMQKLLRTHYVLRNSLIEQIWKRKIRKEYCVRFCILKEGNLISEYIEMTVKERIFISSKYPEGMLKKTVELYKQAMNELYCQSIHLLTNQPFF